MATRFEYNLQTGEVKEIPLTQEELDAAILAKAAEDAFNHPDLVAEREMVAAFEIAKIKRLMFEIKFNQENRLRVLEGKPAILRTQYRDALLSLYKSLPE